MGAATRTSLKDVHPHILRHYCGFYLGNKCCDLRLIQDYLGHRDPNYTVRYTNFGYLSGATEQKTGLRNFCLGRVFLFYSLCLVDLFCQMLFAFSTKNAKSTFREIFPMAIFNVLQPR